MRKLLGYLSAIFAIILLDQYTKYFVASHFYVGESLPVIKGFFNLTYVRNTGAAFGFAGAFDTWMRYGLILVLPVVACVWITVLLIKSAKKGNLVPWAYTLILAGAIGNLIDRFRLDYVVDFLDFHIGSSHFDVFNVADSSISIAAGLLIIDFIIQKKETKALKT